MYPRRQFLQGSLSMAALAALGPLLPGVSFAADSLIRRAIPSSGEALPVIGLAPRVPSTSILMVPRWATCWRCCGCCLRAMPG